MSIPLEGFAYNRINHARGDIMPQKGIAYRIADGFQRMSLKEKYHKDSFLKEVAEAKSELLHAYDNFKMASGDTMVELRIYQLKVAQTRYKYLLEKARELNGQNDIAL